MSLWTGIANVFQEAQVNREIDDELEPLSQRRWHQGATQRKRGGRWARR